MANYSAYSCTLHGDIALSDEWTPIGTDSTSYTATFDGGGYTISNLKIESSDNYAGFFGYIGSGGKVANLTLKSPSVSGEGAVNYVGAIAGYNDGGSIESCTVLGGTVKDCKNSATVSGSSNSGKVSGDGEYIGGIVGCNWYYATVTTCKNSGTVSGNDRVGGIVGYNGMNCTVSSCDNSGTVSGSGDYIGAVAGYNSSGTTVSGCKWLIGTASSGIGGGTDVDTEEYS